MAGEGSSPPAHDSPRREGVPGGGVEGPSPQTHPSSRRTKGASGDEAHPSPGWGRRSISTVLGDCILTGIGMHEQYTKIKDGCQADSVVFLYFRRRIIPE